MLQSFLSRTALFFVSGSLAVFMVACSETKQTTVTGGNKQSLPMNNLAAIKPPITAKLPPEKSEPAKSLASSAIATSPLEQALDKVTGAESISQSAQSPEDWHLVASQYRDAIALLQQVKRDSPNFPFAQRKITEYRHKIQSAQRKANPGLLASSATPPQKRVVIDVPRPLNTTEDVPKATPKQPVATLPLTPPALPASTFLTPNNDVFIAPIKRRVGGTPIIEVTFNGKQRFEMILDTGASGTVITQDVARALGVVTVGKAKANTVSAKAVEFSIGYLDSMEVGGMSVNKIPVAIAGAELETGLLGHDFFGNYDVTIKRNVVEFRPQLHSELNAEETELKPPAFSRGYRFVKLP
ncbi:retropepsin-like aspartic protease family protein [Richelia sinica]|uniref:retropepsin-like aspartic protease family protein n=1 Tax=Richelia sinica TaxID=1357545 RepID=UPI001681C575|nr:retropepsin-like aspartic protease [Richelia sinica]MBD2667405.1 retroviral-like aspartic protease family protein [Richelia sinica FACHB-800]